MTTKTFHMAMVDNVLHLFALWYLNDYVDGQPGWFYAICKVLIACYLVTALLTIVSYILSNLQSNNPNRPKNP